MNDQERVSRGRRTFDELEEVSAAFDAVEAAILRTLADTPIGQETKVLNLHKAAQNLAAVRQVLKDVIDDGVVAQHAIAAAGLTRPN